MSEGAALEPGPHGSQDQEGQYQQDSVGLGQPAAHLMCLGAQGRGAARRKHILINSAQKSGAQGG